MKVSAESQNVYTEFVKHSQTELVFCFVFLITCIFYCSTPLTFCLEDIVCPLCGERESKSVEVGVVEGCVALYSITDLHLIPFL